MQLLLPSELNHRIAELYSRDSLASSARTQREAEQALYGTLFDPSVKCLQTLATNSEKAGFVHLTLECFNHRLRKDYHWRALTEYLLYGLSNMHCLSDLRLGLPPDFDVQPWVENLVVRLLNLEVLIF